MQGGSLVHDAEVIKNLDTISTLLDIDLVTSTVLSSSQGHALKRSLRPGRYTHNSDSQGMPGQDMWGQVRSNFSGMDS